VLGRKEASTYWPSSESADNSTRQWETSWSGFTVSASWVFGGAMYLS
jgi:hypothetical protein